MHIAFFARVSAVLGVGLFAAACSGSSSKAQPTPAPAPAAAPAYPACSADGDCASHGQVCVDGTCKQCRDNSQCSSMGDCGRCQANACVKAPGCCTSDADCGGGRCRAGECK